VSSSQQPKCLDPSKAGRVSLAILLSSMKGEDLQLSSELQEHLRECEACQSCVDTWKMKGQARLEAKQDYDIVNAASAGDPAIICRTGNSGMALFKPVGIEGRGRCVLVSTDNVIVGVQELTIDEFRNLVV
jgi:hypothetical protein